MGLRVGILSPYLWSRPSPVNRQVWQLATRLADRGHTVTVVAPGGDRRARAESRRRVEAVLTGERETLFDPGESSPRLFLVGPTYTTRVRPSLTLVSAPAGVLADIHLLLEREDFDLVHLHEPLLPGLGWTSLRLAPCPLVATFHADPDRARPFWATQAALRRLFDSLDAVLASAPSVREGVAATFAGSFRVVPPGVDTARLAAAAAARGAAGDGLVTALFVGGSERRDGLGTLLRALRRLDPAATPLRLEVAGDARLEARFARLVPAAWEGRVRFLGLLDEAARAERLGRSDVACLPAHGPDGDAVTLLEAMAAGCAVVASRLPLHADFVRDGEDGLLVPPRSARALAAALARLAGDAAARRRLGEAAARRAAACDWETVVDRHEEVYREVASRRRAPLPRRRRQQRELFADFHVHSHHSPDCAMAPADILARAREVGLDVVAVTDHNTVAGGLEARELADRYGVRVIVGEEVKTSEGEVIGLFLEEDIPPGMSFAETIAAIRAQGGIVYVPHPFDRLRTTPSLAVLRACVSDIDVVEVFNSRLAFPSFNAPAERFAQRYRIPGAAGSDAHVLPGIGTALCGIGEFTDARDFVAALAESRIVRRPRSRLYLQSLKLLQTAVGATGRGGAGQGGG